MALHHSSLTDKHEHDLEKATPSETYVREVEADDGVPRQRGPLRKLWAVIAWLETFGVEARGIEWIRPEDRSGQSVVDAFTMWMAANCTISTFALGILGPSIFYLGFKECVLCIIFFNLLSTLPVAIFSTWGPKLGLRQMALSRFSFGYWTAMIPVVLNCIACIGWSTINTIVGGQTLRAVSIKHQIPEWAGILIIALVTLVVSGFGFRVVHLYERWSWIPVVIIFFILLGETARFMVSDDFAGSGPVEAGNILSFGSAIVGFGLGWSSLAADYTCNMYEDVSSVKVFVATYTGLNIPLILIETLGAAMMTTFAAKPDWEDAYHQNSVGGLIAAGLGPLGGFGHFLMVLFALSIISNNLPNMYSFALTFQVLGPWAQAVPRLILVVVGTAIYIALAIVGASHFESALDTLLTFLAYWLSIYSVILLEEHFIFRRSKWSNWHPEDYNTPSRLPLGLAALGALLIGILGAVLGMANVWYVGKVGVLIGDPVYGGDVGFELAGAFAGVTYPIFRYFEKRHIRR